MHALYRTLALLTAADPFLMHVGVNLPWHVYGDIGCNAWGCRGYSTGGFVAETFEGLRGISNIHRVESGPNGVPALAFDAAPRQNGEIYVSLTENRPFACPRGEPADLNGVLYRARLCIPAGAAGSSVQLYGKASQTFASLYSPPAVIEPGWENTCREFSFRLTDPDFDASRIALAGIRINAGAAAGRFHLEELAFDAATPLVYRFDNSVLLQDLRAIREFAAPLSPGDPLVRVFLLVDGRAGIQWSPDSTPVRLDREAVFRDLDTLFQAAASARVKLIPVLLDFGFCDRARIVNGVQLGGRSNAIRDAGKRRALLDEVFAPILERYGNHEAVAAWEIMNEPEWVVRGVPNYSPDPATRDIVALADMQSFVRESAALIRRFSDRAITVGAARRSWLDLWRDLGLTLYQFHYYDSDTRELFPWGHARDLALDAPVLVGEVPSTGTAHAAGDYLASARRSGACGLLLWSCRARDERSDFALASADLVARTPRAAPPGLAHAASFQSGLPLAPEAWFSQFGASMASRLEAAFDASLPAEIAGTSVAVRDSSGLEHLARLSFVSPGQINFLTPAALAPGPVEILFRRIDGGFASVTTTSQAVSPGLFPALLITRVRDGAVVSTERVDGPIDLGPDGDDVILLLFGTGIRNAQSVSVTIGGIEADVLAAVPQGQFDGLDQVNVRIPRALAGRGSVDVRLTAAGTVANLLRVVIR